MIKNNDYNRVQNTNIDVCVKQSINGKYHFKIQLISAPY